MFKGLSSVDPVHARAVNDGICLRLLHAELEMDFASLARYHYIHRVTCLNYSGDTNALTPALLLSVVSLSKVPLQTRQRIRDMGPKRQKNLLRIFPALQHTP